MVCRRVSPSPEETVRGAGATSVRRDSEVIGQVVSQTFQSAADTVEELITTAAVVELPQTGKSALQSLIDTRHPARLNDGVYHVGRHINEGRLHKQSLSSGGAVEDKRSIFAAGRRENQIHVW